MFTFIASVECVLINEAINDQEKRMYCKDKCAYVTDVLIPSFDHLTFSMNDEIKRNHTESVNSVVRSDNKKKFYFQSEGENFFKHQKDSSSVRYDKYYLIISSSEDDKHHNFKIMKRKITSICNPCRLFYLIKESDERFYSIQASYELCLYFLSTYYKNFQYVNKGASGKVFKAEDIITGEKVAIKILINDGNQNYLDNDEISALLKLKHENIVKFHKALQYMHLLMIIMEYVSCNLSNCPIELINNQKVILQLLNVVEFLHSKGVCHRDISTENVLINEDGNIKLADFGNCRVINEKINNYCNDSIFDYENEKSNKTLYNSQTDTLEIYSIAVVISQIYSRQYCLKMKNNPNLRPIIHTKILAENDKQSACRYHLTNIENEVIAEIVHNCLSNNSNSRCTLSSLKQRMMNLFEEVNSV